MTAGIDWLPYGEILTYFRRVFEDYDDKSVDYISGTAHTLLTSFAPSSDPWHEQPRIP